MYFHQEGIKVLISEDKLANWALRFFPILGMCISMRVKFLPWF